MRKRPRMQCRGLFWAADRAKAAHNRAWPGRTGAESVPDGAHAAAITEPQPACLSGCQPDVFSPGPRCGVAFKLVVRKPSPRRNVT
jgi:hypothetical protein